MPTPTIDVIALWSLAVFLASLFAALLAGVTLEPRYSKKVRYPIWILAAIVAYSITFISYWINLTNDAVGILGVSVLVTLMIGLLYKGTWSSKIFVSLTACLIANVGTFMFCGTTDAAIGTPLGLFEKGPYNVPNILLFICIKLVVYSIIFFIYFKFLRKHFHDIIESLDGKMATFIAAPAVSHVGFYIINLFSNANGIVPSHPWFSPLYLTVCIIFVIEFVLIFHSILSASREMKSSAELNVAANIQKSMLPCIFPAFPNRREFDIYATMDPAKEVGGDFYDFFMVDDRHLAIVIADVSDKGVPAALFMVIGKTLIKDHTTPDCDLGKVFSEVNKLLFEANSEGMFITAFEGVLDLVTGEFKFVNAGHELPFICKNSGNFEAYKMRAGFVLAGMEGIKYRSGSMMLEPGDKIFQYTDGVTEAINTKEEFYGMERLGVILNKVKDGTPNEILPAVKRDLDEFVGTADQFDDITMLCLEYKARMEENKEEAE